MTEGYAAPIGGWPYGAHRPSEEYQGGSGGSLGVRVLVILRIQGMGRGAEGTGDLRSTLGCTGLRFFGGRVDGGGGCCWRCFFGGHTASSGLEVLWRFLAGGAGTHLTLWLLLSPWQGSLEASPPSAEPSYIPPGGSDLYFHLYLYFVFVFAFLFAFAFVTAFVIVFEFLCVFVFVFAYVLIF